MSAKNKHPAFFQGLHCETQVFYCQLLRQERRGACWHSFVLQLSAQWKSKKMREGICYCSSIWPLENIFLFWMLVLTSKAKLPNSFILTCSHFPNSYIFSPFFSIAFKRVFKQQLVPVKGVVARGALHSVDVVVSLRCAVICSFMGRIHQRKEAKMTDALE